MRTPAESRTRGGGHQGWKSPHVIILFTLAIFPNSIPSSSSPLPRKSRAAWSKNHAKTKPPAISRLPSLNIQAAQKDDSLPHGKESKSATASYSVRTALSCLFPIHLCLPSPKRLVVWPSLPQPILLWAEDLVEALLKERPCDLVQKSLDDACSRRLIRTEKTSTTHARQGSSRRRQSWRQPETLSIPKLTTAPQSQQPCRP